jgi:uncharacterized protein (DUF2235 family)
MSWVFTGLMRRARDFEREQAHRLDQAYAHWRKEYRKRQGRDRVQERRLLGSRDCDRNDLREQ